MGSSSSSLAFWLPLISLTSHAFTPLELFLGCPLPNDVGGMEAGASLPFTVLQTNHC